MEEKPLSSHEPAVSVTTTDGGGSEIRVADPITRPELDARFHEIKTRIWIVAASSFIGSIVGGSLKAGITPHQAAEAIGRFLA